MDKETIKISDPTINDPRFKDDGHWPDKMVYELKEWYKISESANVEIKVSNDVTTDNSIASTFIPQLIHIRGTNE